MENEQPLGGRLNRELDQLLAEQMDLEASLGKLLMIRLLLMATAFLLTSKAVGAASVQNEESIIKWNKHSATERLAYATAASQTVKDTDYCSAKKCAPLQIKTCIDEIGRPPIPPAAQNETVFDVLRICLLYMNKPR